MNEMNDQQEMMNNVQGWNTMPSHDIMIPVPIKIQPPLGILDQNNIQMNNSSPHPSVIHTSPQTPHVSNFLHTNIWFLFKHITLFLGLANKYVY